MGISRYTIEFLGVESISLRMRTRSWLSGRFWAENLLFSLSSGLWLGVMTSNSQGVKVMMWRVTGIREVVMKSRMIIAVMKLTRVTRRMGTMTEN